MAHLSDLDLAHLRTKRSGFSHLRRNLITYAVFAAVSCGAVFYSLGYKLNLATGSIQQTGIIQLDTRIGNFRPDIYLNGSLQQDHFPYRYTQVFPGTYSVSIKKEGYQEWNRSIRVFPNQVASYQYVVLVLNEPHVLSSSEASQYSVNPDPDTSGIEIRQNELWLNGKFVTRTSEDILVAQWFPDHRHIAYQSGSQILLCEPDGVATQKLLSVTKKAPLSFSFAEGGRVLVYQDSGGLQAVQLYDRF